MLRRLIHRLRAHVLPLILGGLTLGAGCDSTMPASDQQNDIGVVSEGSNGFLGELDLTGPLPEVTSADGIFPIPASQTYIGLLRKLHEVASDPSISGLYVRLGSRSLSWTQTEELSEEMDRLRHLKKYVTCHAHQISNTTAWLFLKGCDRIWLSPAGSVETIGIAAQVIYLKGILDKLRVTTDFLSMGRYKSFAETFTREGPSDEARESLSNTLASFRETWLEGLESARHFAKPIEEIVEQGPWTAEEAEGLGLIDAQGSELDARKDAKSQAQTEKSTPLFGPKSGKDSELGISSLIRVLTGSGENADDSPHIAVLLAHGGISMSGGSGGLSGDGKITDTGLTKVIRRLKNDEHVKAVILRINSPGGSALASDLIWHELMALREAKPLIASVGDMAASGGYYLASAAQRIVAPRNSIVGSIGVVSGKFILGSALEEVGVNTVTITANGDPSPAPRAAYLSAMTPWDDATRERVRVQAQRIYDLFIARIVAGRDMLAEEVQASAEGRIWSGLEAYERGLVDELGGFNTALQVTRDIAKLPEGTPIVLESLSNTWLEKLFGGEQAKQSVAALLPKSSNALEAVIPPEFTPFLATVQSLLYGERVVATMPFAIRIH